jgi:LytS/YehU family sensor histidine kinase
MYRYLGPYTALSFDLNGRLFLANIMDLYGGPFTALIIGLHGGLYFAIIMDRYGDPKMPYLALHG